MTNEERKASIAEYAKLLIEHNVERIFDESQDLYDAPYGDISVDLAIQLENAIDRLAEVVTNAIEFQILNCEKEG